MIFAGISELIAHIRSDTRQSYRDDCSRFSPKHHLIQPTIIYDFPLAVSPLSKIKPDEPDWVERFEFYIGGFEVGNAFSELNDPVDQDNRFQQQIEQKETGDEEAMSAVDDDYVRALGYGLPPTAGEGIGIDRLTMLLTNSSSIRDVILFPLMRPRQKSAEQVVAKEDRIARRVGRVAVLPKCAGKACRCRLSYSGLSGEPPRSQQAGGNHELEYCWRGEEVVPRQHCVRQIP